ncbi:MAG: methionine--tRNA ligase subunit beta [Candidatus Nealsonbacteria bacterium CG_4_9_14_0_8_um_filter_35_12]|uniref:Methionine--tRNA ligase n=1 Tax=Candidatus Nealsonbacteria bacterium CG_4_9_14_0_8_um_filter_35_12 TaxID=1974692 RepID=A0A2M8DNK4_9BACT|nr:MAG: methionine--tRNA ligase subunit beta [Candidatus Nealsonbacteria bacterium CG_4_9_14_0_8_um_filter_35_12]
MISFEDFQKIDLRVAKIIEAENVEGSEKLLKLKIDLGSEIRQIVAGIAKFYKPEDLIGKEIIVVANLEPKVLRGLESQGMLLAAETEGTISLLIPDQEVLPGAKIH